MPLPEFRQWQVYNSMFPIGPRRDDWRIAQLAAMYFNAHRRRGDPVAPVRDFMWQSPQAERNEDEDAQALLSFLGTLPPPPVMN